MKNFRHFSAALVLGLTLSVSAIAGEIHSTDKPLCPNCTIANELDGPEEMVQTAPGDIHVPGFLLMAALDLLT